MKPKLRREFSDDITNYSMMAVVSYNHFVTFNAKQWQYLVCQQWQEMLTKHANNYTEDTLMMETTTLSSSCLLCRRLKQIKSSLEASAGPEPGLFSFFASMSITRT